MDTRLDQESERRPVGLSMPVQAPPVYRSAVGAAGAAGAVGGVEPDGLGLPGLARWLDIDWELGPFYGDLHI
ncbi:hypothetical protein ABTX77_41700 [Streptomyces sp. NPDC097704]|uniref:hypothetical protein n=1 Tax=Streptomyces sp. NPDC097704 TaxID=3157101 RepID=UPI003330CD50